MKYYPWTQLCEHCTPSLVSCIKKSFISMDGSNDVREDHTYWRTYILLLITCKHGWWSTREPCFTCQRWWRPMWSSCKHMSRVRSGAMKTYDNSSLAYRLPTRVFKSMDVIVHTHAHAHRRVGKRSPSSVPRCYGGKVQVSNGCHSRTHRHSQG